MTRVQLLASPSSAEVVKGSSAPAFQHLLRTTVTYSPDMSERVCVCVHTATYTHHLYVCMSTSVCSSLCCLDNLLPFLFLFALGAESGLTPTQEQKSEGGRSMTSYRASQYDTHGSPTCSHPSSSRCRLIVLIRLQ